MIGDPPKILVIKSDISELANVEAFVNEVFEYYNITRKYFNKVFLCISEAVVNSIVHGNKNDKDKKVYICADWTPECISLKIRDEGEGFNLDEVVNPTTNENVRKECGRGIHIIKSYSEQIRYNKKENSFQFKIGCK